MTELFDLYALFRRMRTEPGEISETILCEGGEVLEHRLISRLIKSPFYRPRTHAIIYEFRSHYGNRRGCWYVRTSSDKHKYDWYWLDSDGGDSLPVERKNALVIRNVQVVGWWADAVFISSIIFVSLVAAAAIYLIYF